MISLIKKMFEFGESRFNADAAAPAPISATPDNAPAAAPAPVLDTAPALDTDPPPSSDQDNNYGDIELQPLTLNADT